MAKRSINAQIEEIARILQERRDHVKRLRGSDLSRAEEHLIRLESALATLQWFRDLRRVLPTKDGCHPTAGASRQISTEAPV